MSKAFQGLKRTHSCNVLNKDLLGQEVVLMGWVQKRRDHGGLIFADLRDRSGLVQIVFSPDINTEAFHLAETIRSSLLLLLKVG